MSLAELVLQSQINCAYFNSHQPNFSVQQQKYFKCVFVVIRFVGLFLPCDVCDIFVIYWQGQTMVR